MARPEVRGNSRNALKRVQSSIQTRARQAAPPHFVIVWGTGGLDFLPGCCIPSASKAAYSILALMTATTILNYINECRSHDASDSSSLLDTTAGPSSQHVRLLLLPAFPKSSRSKSAPMMVYNLTQRISSCYQYSSGSTPAVGQIRPACIPTSSCDYQL